MSKVLIPCANGTLGSMVASALTQHSAYNFEQTMRPDLFALAGIASATNHRVHCLMHRMRLVPKYQQHNKHLQGVPDPEGAVRNAITTNDRVSSKPAEVGRAGLAYAKPQNVEPLPEGTECRLPSGGGTQAIDKAVVVTRKEFLDIWVDMVNNTRKGSRRLIFEIKGIFPADRKNFRL